MRFAPIATLALLAAMPLSAQEYRFSKEIGPGGRVAIENINGTIEVSRASGRTAEVIVTKVVKKGDGSLVKAIMEETGSGIHVCTIYLNRDPNRHTCENNNINIDSDRNRVEMNYWVRIPPGARLTIENVNGNVTVTGADVDSRIETVNGDVHFDGVGALSLNTVNGNVFGTFSRATWEGRMEVETVNGSIELTFPADLSADISGETVNGDVDSRFPITIEGKWGPKSFTGRIGSGGRRLNLSTVNGGIKLLKR